MNDNNTPQPIYEQLSSLRDLVVLIERDGDNLPDVVYQLAIEKSHRISALLEERRLTATPAAMEYPDELDWEAKEPQVVHYDNQQEEDVNAEDDLSLHSPEASCGDDATDDIDIENNEVCGETEVVESVACEQVEECDSATAVAHDEELLLQPAHTSDTEEDACEKALPVAPVADCRPTATPTPANVTTIEDVYRGSATEGERAAVTLGDAMVAKRAKELRKALSLNDRFRFRRVLFAGNDAEMNSVLEAIDKMDSYDKVSDMLLSTYKWDVNDEVVKEFLTIVELHFK